jgi:hypothetical protein
MIFRSFTAYLLQKISALIDTFSLEPDQISSHDRTILENVILPYFDTTVPIRKVLFVGCSAYTHRYKELLEHKEYWTIDPNCVKRKYGAEKHIIDSITNIRKYVVKNYFDVIIMNGVIGFGLNRVGDIEQAIDACYESLASAGILLVGWNDRASRIPVDIRRIRALSKFREYYFRPLQTCHYRTEGSQQHTFSFYRKE